MASERSFGAPLTESWDPSALLVLSRHCCIGQVASWANREDVGRAVCGGAGRLLRTDADEVRHLPRRSYCVLLATTYHLTTVLLTYVSSCLLHATYSLLTAHLLLTAAY